jgi:hypothetical protein
MSNTYESLTSQQAADLSSDLVWGVRPISVVLGRTERATYHMLVNGQLPAQLVGGRWVASKTGLRQHFSKALGAVA